MSANNLLQATYVFVVVLWPTMVFASASTLDDTLKTVSFVAWAAVIALSTVAGLTALLNRVSAELQAARDAGRDVPPLKVFVAANLFGSWLTGLFTFLICEHFDVPGFLEAALIIGGSYIGARLIERTMEGLVDRVMDRVGMVFGARKPGE